MADPSTIRDKRSAPWKGRRKVADPKSKAFAIRFTPTQFEQVAAAANDSGLSVGTYARTVLLGSPGPRAVRKPHVVKQELARILGELGKLGSNVNQIARAFNQQQAAPTHAEVAEIRANIVFLRNELMSALGREP
jgi:Bacterial mobilisation protein (MobC)